MAGEGLKLKRLYPADPCLAGAAAYSMKGKDKTIIDIGEKVTKVARIAKGKAVGYRDISIGIEDICFYIDNSSHDELLNFFKDALGQWDDEPHRLLISGSGGKNSHIIDFLKKNITEEIEVFDTEIEEAVGFAALDGVEFAAILGAGIRELSLIDEERKIGIDDEIALSIRVREKIHIMPIVILSSVAIVFMLHYGAMRYQMRNVERTTINLEQEKNEANELREIFEGLKMDESNYKSELDEINRNIEFFEQGIESRINSISTILKSVEKNSDAQLAVLDIKPVDIDSTFNISGTSRNITSMNLFILGMQNAAWCDYLKIKKVTKETTQDEFLGDSETYTFEMSIVKN
ncbi:MAG: hypothetical protein DDT40_00765 [candidate division WS2 bacterium]|nr:hypothetical protein [Candidatus Psychracetigena formicireducens]